MGLIKYRPQTSRFSKKQSEDQAKREREDLITLGLDDDSARAVLAVSRADRLDYQVRILAAFVELHAQRCWLQLIAAIVKHIVDSAPKRGGVLIFLPGVQEITQCIEAVRSVVGGADVFPLHANLSSDEQRRVFVSSKSWKIIAATNVAEARICTCRSVTQILTHVTRRPSPSTTFSTSWIVERSRRRPTTRRMACPACRRYGSLARRAASAVVEQGAPSRERATSCTHAGKKIASLRSRYRKSSGCRWKASLSR
jgi:hypothetical protein